MISVEDKQIFIFIMSVWLILVSLLGFLLKAPIFLVAFLIIVFLLWLGLKDDSS